METPIHIKVIEAHDKPMIEQFGEAHPEPEVLCKYCNRPLREHKYLRCPE